MTNCCTWKSLQNQIIHVSRLSDGWVPRYPADGHFWKKFALFLICCFIYCSFEQAHNTFWTPSFQILAKSLFLSVCIKSKPKTLPLKDQIAKKLNSLAHTEQYDLFNWSWKAQDSYSRFKCCANFSEDWLLNQCSRAWRKLFMDKTISHLFLYLIYLIPVILNFEVWHLHVVSLTIPAV